MNSLASTVKPLLTKAAIARLVLGWGAFAALLAAGPALQGHLPGPALALLLTGIVAVILVCAFGVVHEAEHLARRLGDPYGTLVLTLSIVLIEVILIAAVLLGPGEHATIARDSVMAVSMIILNLVVGASLLIGGLRHGGLAHNRTGTSAYLGMLIVLGALAFGLPGLIGTNGAYAPAQELPIIVITVLLYAFFLWRQMGAQADDFREVDPRLTAQDSLPDAARTPFAVTFRQHRGEILGRLALLVATVLPIVLLSHDMAALLDDGLARLGAPVALSGVLIALIVFLPESITAVRAALAGEIQRVSNLCHGALVSTVGLTIPAVLVISLLTGQHVLFAETPANLLLLGVSLLLSVATFSGKQVTATHGAAHLALFGIYALVLFA
jgi:Ca2+:H+ antiporter